MSALLLLATACGAPEQGVPEMNDQERQTVEAYTDMQAPVCLGRFQVDMPSQLKPSFSSLTVNDAKISAKPNSRQMFERFIEKRQKALQEHPADARDAPFLKNFIRHDDIVIFDRNRSNGAYDFSRTLEGYRFVGLTMFSVEIDAIDLSDEKNRKHRAYLESNKSERLKQVEYLLNHLSPRQAGEIPERPGLCFEHGFLAGGADQQIPGAALTTRDERVFFVFTDKTRKDVSVEFTTDSALAEKTTLLDRTNDAESALSEDKNFSVIRKGKVDLDGIKQAEEWLVTGTTPSQRVRGGLFNIEANSKIGSPKTPWIDISLFTGEYGSGAGENLPKLEKASLTDAEAVGLWDAITRTFKPRPGAF